MSTLTTNYVVLSSRGYALGCVFAGSKLVFTVFSKTSETAVRRDLKRKYPKATPGSSAQKNKAQSWLGAFFKGTLKASDIPVEWNGIPPFTQKTLKRMGRIPRGKVLTYGELARRVGSPKGSRAVGQAMRRNPFAPFYPCHRVVSASGLGGYGGKMHSKTKTALLKDEGAKY